MDTPPEEQPAKLEVWTFVCKTEQKPFTGDALYKVAQMRSRCLMKGHEVSGIRET